MRDGGGQARGGGGGGGTMISDVVSGSDFQAQ